MPDQRKTSLRNTLFVTFCLLMLGGCAAVPSVVSFEGDKGPGVAVCKSDKVPTHCERAEQDVAASGRQVTQVTWQNVNVYDTSGKLLKSTPLGDIIRGAGLDPVLWNGKGSQFEPHIVYNEFIERWIITVTCKNDCTLVSATSDATGPWGGVYLTCQQGGPCLERNPAFKIGYDRNGTYICGGRGGIDNPATVPGVAYECFALRGEDVKAIAQGKAPVHLNRTSGIPLDVVPVIDHNRAKAPDAPAFFLNKSCDRTAPYACQRSANFAIHWVVNSFTWTGPTSGSYNAQHLVKTGVGSKENIWLYNTPCCGESMSVPQAGTDTTLRAAISHRLMNVVQHGTKLYGVLGTGPCLENCGAQGRDANNILIWSELDCADPKACVVTRTEKLSHPDLHLLLGTIGVDDAGNMGIVGTAVNARSNLSVLLWTRKANDAAFSAPQVVAAGTQPYVCVEGNSRYNMSPQGNSAGSLTGFDPIDRKTLWASQQWANDANPCVWNTRIVGYRVGEK